MLIFVLFSTTWTSGCAGFAEPLPQLSVTPSSLSVSTPVGSTGSHIVTVTNVGATSLDVSEAAVSGPGFSVAGVTPPFTLSTGQSRSFTVKFLASAAASADGILSIVTDRRHRPIVVPLHGKGGSSTGVTSVAVSPSTASAVTSSKVQFAASIQGTTTNESVTWTATIGSITSSGLFTAPSNSGTGKVTAASVADPTKSASATVTITASPAPAPPTPSVTSVTISPASASSVAGGMLQFAATVQGTTSNKAVNWTATLGSITSAGVYAAPAIPGTARITATSNADPTKSASANVIVTALALPPPTTPTPIPGSTGQLTASVSTLNFNNVSAGNTSTLPVTFTNAGNSNIAISKVSISGAGYNASGISTGLILPPGQTATLNVTFAPAATGTITGNVNVTSSASNSPASITLSGTGVQPIAHSATLTWTASTTPIVTGYNVYRATASGAYATPLNSSPIPASAIQFEDSTVQAGQTYYYVVTSIDSSNMQSTYSNEVSATIPTP